MIAWPSSTIESRQARAALIAASRARGRVFVGRSYIATFRDGAVRRMRCVIANVVVLDPTPAYARLADVTYQGFVVPKGVVRTAAAQWRGAYSWSILEAQHRRTGSVDEAALAVAQ